MLMALPLLSVVPQELVKSRLENLTIQEVKPRVLMKVAMTICYLVTRMFSSSKILSKGGNIGAFRLSISPKLLRLLPLVAKNRKFFLVMSAWRGQFSIAKNKLIVFASFFL